MRACAVLASCLVALGCGRIGYYPMALQGELAAPEGGTPVPTTDGGTAPRDGGDGAPPGADGGDAGRPPTGPALGCAGERLALHWGFESDLEHWEYRPPYLETAVWDPAGHGGDGTGGSVRFETPDAPHGWLVLPAPQGDMRGRRGSVWLKLESGGPVNALAYVSNGNDYGADREVTLTPGDWTCFEFSFDATVTPGFSPTNIQIFGFALNASGPVTLLVDDVGVQ